MSSSFYSSSCVSFFTVIFFLSFLVVSFFTTIFFTWFLPCCCKLFHSHLLPLLPSTTVCSAVHTCTVYVQLHLVSSVTSRGVYVACYSPTRTVAHAQYISKREIASIMINFCKETLSSFHQNLSCLSFSLLDMLKFLRLKLQVSWLCAQRNKWFSLQSLCCWWAWHVVLPHAHAWISKVLKLQLVSWLCVKKQIWFSSQSVLVCTILGRKIQCLN